MRINVSNSVYSRSYSLNISIQPSVLLIGPVDDTMQINTATSYTYKIQIQSLGEPSCALIRIAFSTYQFTPFTIGTSSAYCAQLFPSVRYDSVYLHNSSVWYFPVQMANSGFFTMSATVKNSLSSQTVIKYLTVSDLDCHNPTISIENRTSLFYSPCVYKKSDLISVVSDTTINCVASLENVKQWSVYLISPFDGSIMQTIDLSSNPSIQQAELILYPSSLNVGLYMLEYKVTMSGPIPGIGAFVSVTNTFIKIQPTGFDVISFNGQISQIMIGTKQELQFDPFTYSVDLDSPQLDSSTRFLFYCTVVDNGIANAYPQSSLNIFIDLKEFQVNSNFGMSSDTTCFNNSG
jgi:hypothetical protein